MKTVAAPRREALSSRLRGERGSISAAIIMIPLSILAVFLAIHVALVMHGRNVAAAAAQDALRAAQLEGATIGNGQQAAERTLALFEGIGAAEVKVTKDDDFVTVRIVGNVTTPMDGFFNHFDISRSGPVERFYLESERG